MNLKFPTVALNLIAELCENKGSCAQAILTTAKNLGLNFSEEALCDHNFSCGAESALAKVADKPTVEAVLSMVSEREQQGLLRACPASPERTSSSCFHKCPLVMDLLLHALQMKS